ncbi:methylated-DNA--[protein]-cysteine S-methyltransferase [Cryobacterium tepidiphilum]|jgi:methylated-DNA-[protein]-cysteine S-methyltransferase|uniref:Methylated-DNA--protein-cysteine methyltransferase n=1 Tax=Cryobacterium tepidiphilum TaxID=2486026 RepID=A0A3M8LE90_9MICO|nr:methylated-DNA--[protein]-cysteine S-methyltransferase [Cryobacterium tepidiphilum]RNE63665.1 methylated-DNA--[protein]-cysteine S-methyltransferase [Cryobacterium tepidiphilum]
MTSTAPFLTRVTSPIGRLELTADAEHILSLTIERSGRLPFDDEPERPSPLLERAREQLTEYFAGTRQDFDLPVRYVSGTSFQQSVWDRLAALRFGDVTSYGQLGQEIGKPGSGRAVGGAVGANPLPLLIGCHRVLAANGRITGYSAGEGVPTKVWLLAHEGIPHTV